MIRTAIPALLLTLSLAACSSPETDEQTAAAEQSQAAASEAATPPAAEPAPAELAGSCDDTQAQWIIGKTAGASLTDASGAVIAENGAPITMEIAQAAADAHKLYELWTNARD